jgi:NMD protein affecting ribosome stability and mRNA decay
MAVDIKHNTSNCLSIPRNIPGIKTNYCPFCDTKTFSGSWAPETCPNCGAYFFMDVWVRKIE